MYKKPKQKSKTWIASIKKGISIENKYLKFLQENEKKIIYVFNK